MCCGSKYGGERYAPDESEALELLAHDVGSSLGTLALESDTGRDSLAEMQGLILLELRALSRKFNGQPL